MDTMTTNPAGLSEEEDLPTAPIRLDDAGDDAALMTTGQMSDALRTAEDQLHEATFDLDAARMAFTNRVNQAAAEPARLALEAEQRPILDEREADVAHLADRLERRARDVIRETESTPPSLTTSDLARANELRSFLVEDMERLSLAELRSRVRHALATGDVPALYLFSREVPRRLDHEAADPSGHPGEGDVLRALDRLAREAGQRLPRDRSLAPLRERAEKLLHGSLDLHRDAARRQYEGDARTAMEIALGGPGVKIPDA